MNRTPAAAHKPKSRLMVVAVSLAVLSGALGLTVTSSSAWAASCSTIPGCTKGSTVANKFASTTVSTALTAFRMLVEQYITMLQDSLTRLANQGSNNVQNFTKTQSSLMDSYKSQSTSLDVGQARATAAIQYIPSRTACRTESNSSRVATAQLSAATRARYEATQRAATDYSANAPGTPSERGSLAAAQNTFNEIMNGFCDPAVMSPPTGVGCTLLNDSTGQPMTFRYAQPYQAVFGVPNSTIPPAPTNGEHRAARLFVRMAIEPVPIDPLRGPMLNRQEGQSMFLRRQADIAAFNLARGALDRMVDDRIGTTAPGSESVEYLRQRAWADASGMAKDVIDRAGQPTDTNYDDLAPLVGDVNKISLQILINFERLLAIKAAYLARVVAERPAGNTGVASRNVSN